MAKRVSISSSPDYFFRNISGMTGRDIVGGALAVYGSRTSVVIYNAIKEELEEWTLRFEENDEV